MKFELYKNAANEWRWRLRATNGQILATGSEGYVKKSDCLHGIDRVKETNKDTPVIEVDK